MFLGQNIFDNEERAMRRIRGKDMSMIFQEPMTSLNPVFTVGEQISETILCHERLPGKEAEKKTVELLRTVGIPSPEIRRKEYPHQMSGGMRQRVMIAMAIACNPMLLIADEPTTALDVTIQAQIIELLDRLKKENRMSLLLITHDLGIIAEWAQRVLIMYAGRIVESAAVREIFARPGHPYTMGLLESLPVRKGKRLRPIPGAVPGLGELPEGCKFSTRCRYVIDDCRRKEPELVPVEPSLPGTTLHDHIVRCIRTGEI